MDGAYTNNEKYMNTSNNEYNFAFYELIDNMEDVENYLAKSMFNYMASNGYRHHVAVAKGKYASAVEEVFSKYLGYKIDRI